MNDNGGAISAIATIWIAVFTATLYAATRTMQEGTDATLAHLQDASRRELRAYVGTKGIDLLRLPAAGECPGFTVNVDNFGLTPAYEIVHSVAWGIDSLPHSVMDEHTFAHVLAGVKPTTLILDPREAGRAFAYIPDPKFALDPVAAEAIKIGHYVGNEDQVRLYCFGIVRYRDVFNNVHVRHFCHAYGGEPDGNKVRYCADHNGEYDIAPDQPLTRWQRANSWLCSKLDRNT